MLTRRKRDWFPVVATDLFCGALAAVIILDAIAPKETGATGMAALLSMEYPKDKGAACTDPGRLVFGFSDDIGHRYNSLADAQAFAAEGPDTCIVQMFFSDVLVESSPRDPVVIVAEYAGASPTAKIYGAFSFECVKASRDCPVLDAP